jgi:hypothetical protein
MQRLGLRAAMIAAAVFSASAANASIVDFSGSMTGAGIVTPSAACAPIPFHGSITAAPGTSPLGSFTYSHDVCTQAGVGPIVGTFVIDFGIDQFSGTLNGAGTADPTPGLFDLLINYTITGGTGRFVGATGSFVGSGTADPRVRPSIVSLSFQAVPEPSTWALMLLGMGAIGVTIRRRPRTYTARPQLRSSELKRA